MLVNVKTVRNYVFAHFVSSLFPFKTEKIIVYAPIGINMKQLYNMI